jgi:predicted amidohydrolase YtcJ
VFFPIALCSTRPEGKNMPMHSNEPGQPADKLPPAESVRHDRAGIWGLKMGMDGGVEGGYLCQPYASNPDFRGHAFWEAADFERVVEHAVGRGWRVGCDAVGDCAVERVLDAYEHVSQRHPDLVPGSLVIEHAALRMYTAAGGRLLGEDPAVGTISPGAFADLVAFRTDLLDCPVDDLPSQQPALTVVGGQPVHDPEALMPFESLGSSR